MHMLKSDNLDAHSHIVLVSDETPHPVEFVHKHVCTQLNRLIDNCQPLAIITAVEHAWMLTVSRLVRTR